MSMRYFFKSSQINLLRFLLGALAALSVIFSGTAFADLAYISDGTLTYINSQGVEQVTDITAESVFSFNHNGSTRILVKGGNAPDIISIYDPANFSVPIASADLYPDVWNSSSLTYVAEFGSNIVLAIGSDLLEVNPDTCEIVSSYYGDIEAVYSYGGQLIVKVMVKDGSDGGISYGHINAVTMNPLGNITGTFDAGQYDYSVKGSLAVSGGELYYALGKNNYYLSDFESAYHGIYRVSKMVGSMTVNNAERITSDIPCSLCTDGRGGLYYTVWNIDSNTVQYIYHWDGTNSSLVYDAGSSGIGDESNTNALHYDINRGILYAVIGGTLTALVPDSSGQLSVSGILPVYPYFDSDHTFAVVGNPSSSSGSGTEGSVTPDPQTPSQSTVLPSGVIEPAPALSSSVIDNLAALVSIDSSALHLITQENISAPSEPTQTMKEYMQSDGYDPAYKLNTLTVNEDGYYVFMVNIPDEFVGKKVSDIKIYALKNADFASAFYGLINGVLNYGEITNLFGVKIDTLEKQVLAVGLLQAGTPFSVYLAKLIIALLAGGCSLTGTGTLIFCAVCLAGIFFVKR